MAHPAHHKDLNASGTGRRPRRSSSRGSSRRLNLAAAAIVGTSLMLPLMSGCKNFEIGTERSIPSLRNEAEWAIDRGRYEVAEEAYAEIVTRVPGDRPAHLGLGRALLAQGDALRARRHLEIAYQQSWDSPDEDFAYEVAGYLAEAMAETGDADRLYTFLTERMQATGDARDYLRWGEWAMRLGDPDTAKVAFLTAARNEPGASAAPYLHLATLNEQIGDTEAAAIRLRQAYGVEPENPEVISRLEQYVSVVGPTVALPPEQQLPEGAVMPPADAMQPPADSGG
ncbi:MAG: tetratricopeptide repeat protein [Planctomycetota bacterium]